MPKPLDPGHALKRKKLALIVKGLLALSIAMVVLGAISFVSSVLVDSINFSAFMAFSGIMLIGGGGFLFLIMVPVALFTFAGSLFRYEAEEVVPVAEDVARRGMDLHEELAPRAAKVQRAIAPDIAAADEEIAHGIARGARRGWDEAGK